MIFSSIEFLLVFIPIFFVLYWLTPAKMKNVVLFAGSLLFYAYGVPEYLMLLLVSVCVNYLLGLVIGGVRKNGNERKIVLSLAALLNVGLLFVCKAWCEVLPLGISFYTFQALSYLMDVYRQKEQSEKSFLNFATYMTMFPQLISGPIVRYGEVKERLVEKTITAEKVTDGLKIFTLGLAAKVLLADRMGYLWQEVQVTGFESISTALCWIAAAAYSMKIYFDFYGYSLMAVGLGRMLGFELPQNFDNPYMAVSVRSFYRRWHMTLGRWFCDYVYIPLGGSRKGAFRTTCNLLVVWVLTAVWHGGTANFLIWGMFLCFFILLERMISRSYAGKWSAYAPVRALLHIYLWVVIAVSWMCFAITDVSELQVYLSRMFGISEGLRISAGDWQMALERYWYLLVGGALAATSLIERFFRKWKNSFVVSILLIAVFWFCVYVIQRQGQNPFMYFTY